MRCGVGNRELSVRFSAEAPYRPEVTGETDTSNFDEFESDFTPVHTQPPNVTAAFTGHHLPFVGFTYTHGSQMSDNHVLRVPGGQDDANAADPAAAADNLPPPDPEAQRVQAALQRAEQERNELQRQLSDFLNHAAEGPSQERLIAQLKDEVQILKKRLEDEAQAAQRPAKEANVEELERKIKDSKEKNRQLILDKQDLQKVSRLCFRAVLLWSCCIFSGSIRSKRPTQASRALRRGQLM